MVPDQLHVIPVGNDAMFHGVFKDEDATLQNRLITNVTVLDAKIDQGLKRRNGQTQYSDPYFGAAFKEDVRAFDLGAVY